jgi:hypothetical protein
MILSRVAILQFDKNTFYLLSIYLRTSVTQTTWLQERRKERQTVIAKLVSEFFKILIENSTVKYEDT